MLLLQEPGNHKCTCTRGWWWWLNDATWKTYKSYLLYLLHANYCALLSSCANGTVLNVCDHTLYTSWPRVITKPNQTSYECNWYNKRHFFSCWKGSDFFILCPCKCNISRIVLLFRGKTKVAVSWIHLCCDYGFCTQNLAPSKPRARHLPRSGLHNHNTHKKKFKKNTFIKTLNVHADSHQWQYIDHNVSLRISVTFIHLFIGLFVYLFIHYSLDWLSSYLRAWFRRESGRTFIFWWEQSLIQNRPIPRTLPLSVSLSLSPSDEFSRSLSLPITLTFSPVSP